MAYLKRFLSALSLLPLPWLLPILSLLLTLPSISIGLNLDDLLHRAMFIPTSGFEALHREPVNPFSFYDGQAEHTQWMMERGFGAWWTHPELKVVFWRPLTALTHAIDYTLWPDLPELMHLQNLLWFCILIAAATRLFRQWLGTGLSAAVAATIYALDDGHGFAVGWIANRNALTATTFGLLALLCWTQAERKEWRSGYYLTPILLLLSLLSGEFGIATLAWMGAYSLVLGEGTLLARARRLIPSIGVSLVWLILYLGSGAGTRFSGAYINPFESPLRYLGAFLTRAPILIQSALTLPPADAIFLLPPGQSWILTATGTFTTVLACVLFYPLFQKRESRVQRPAGATTPDGPQPWERARFLALGSMLSLPPICATFPMDRLLFFVGLGSSGLVGLFIEAQVQGNSLAEAAGGRSTSKELLHRLSRGFLWVWVVLHLTLAPFLLPIRSTNPGRWMQRLQELADSLTVTPEQTHQTTLLLNAPDGTITGFLPLLKAIQGQPAPDRMFALAVGTQTVELFRAGANVLELEPEGGFLLDMGSRLVRDPANRVEDAALQPASGFSAHIVTYTADNRPLRVRFTFIHELLGPQYRWIVWDGHKLSDFAMPASGQQIIIRRESLRF